MNSLQSQERYLAELDSELKREASEWQWSGGIDHLAAITIVAEMGDLRRFASAPNSCRI